MGSTDAGGTTPPQRLNEPFGTPDATTLKPDKSLHNYQWLMPKPARMTAGGGDWAAMIPTLTDLIRFVDAGEVIPAHRKRSYKSALNTTRRLLGNGLADIRADPREILAQLDRRSPVMAGMSRPSYATS